MAVGAMQGILGCRADFDGLRIDPCIPPAWRRFEVTRVFRGVTYRITVRNPDGVSKGVRALRVDGKPVRGTVIPHRPGTQDVKVDVLMGPRATRTHGSVRR
jgi:cellobiose phosphorylase